MKDFSTFSCTIRREVAVQRCPVVPKAPQTAPSRASSRSASALTNIAFLPPSSRETRLPNRPQVAAIWWPTVTEPVKEMARTSGCSTSAAPASSPKPVTSPRTPLGSPASMSTSASLIATSGVSSAGLKTTALPANRAGISFQQGIAIGKFQGVMQPTTPIGTRSAKARFWRSSLGTTSPIGLRPWPAMYLAMSMPSWTSPRASVRTLPISRVMSWASSSFLSSRILPARAKISALAGTGVRAHSGWAASAAWTASSMSRAPPLAKCPTTSARRAGLTESKVCSPWASRHSPATRLP